MDTDALRDLVESHHEAAFGWALHCCSGDAALAEETLQQAYLKILQGRARFGGGSAFRTWLFGVVKITAREERRKAAWRSWLPAAFAREAPAPAPAPGEGIEAAEEARVVMSLLEGLSPRQREVLHLVFYQGISIEEAAAVMGVGPGSARQHYARGKAALRRRIRAREAPDERRG